MKELKIEIYGRVQGVGFRHFVKENAEKLGIVGYVMNRDDGSVLVVGQNGIEGIEIFLNVVQKGPRLSKVEGVSYKWRKSKKKYDKFSIETDRGLIEDQTRSFVNLGKRVLGVRSKVPRHVAIIPDGNRRWAKKNGMKALAGHKHSSSYEKFNELFEEARNLGVEYLTFWGFSTENWTRGEGEVNGLFNLLVDGAKKFREGAKENKIRFRHLGRKDRLPKKLVKELELLENETAEFDGFNVQLCLDYGGRDEIVRAVNKILKSGVQEVKEDDLVGCLDSSGVPDPDLVIRTSGEKRTSGFMPFQSAYSELYFSEVHFPDFGGVELRKAVEEYSKRGRRFGG